ncbi:carbohydrate kinase family protein [Extibacter muris]|uniref:carbohydrate kinase family protein n=1 Tax=Extibacter muris TaxID=1796622 RepID=UPI001D05CC37|nr:carbohydrate kinase family protein [Extibacter muris]MCB6202190.1 carbohydrate kinase family protein [Extibacter muris]MCQ4662625.1 carbohydrate kinase family protein [Extibacter muris]MCQ4693092.1 carbohydrate kinase family protein [Extibacter muris]
MDGEILIIGAAIVDVLARPVGADVFKTGSLPVDEICMSTGGDALNEATVLARLGKRVRLATVIGKDMAGRMLAEHCAAEGITLEEGCFCDDIDTGINIVLVEDGGERSFLTNPYGSLRRLSLSHIKMPFSPGTKILCFASIFVSPEIDTDGLCQIFKTAKEQGITVCADMTKCKNKETAEDLAPALAYVDYLFANADEAALITGMRHPEESAACLMRAGAANVIVKCGGDGCVVRSAEDSFAVPAVPGVRCIDTTGAGDSFAAGFLSALSEGRTLKDCAEYANRCGALAVASAGATEWSKA